MDTFTHIVFLPERVKAVIEPGRPGAYALRVNDPMEIGYVGRSDTCLQTRLSTHNHLYKFDYVIFRYAESPAQAFLFECEAFHALEQTTPGMSNKYHPAAPDGTGLICPYCDFGAAMRRYLRVA